jgi:hypothetical protein
MKKQIMVDEYFIAEVSSKCSTYQEAVEIIQNYEDENSYPRVEYLEVKEPIMPVDSKKVESNNMTELILSGKLENKLNNLFTGR